MGPRAIHGSGAMLHHMCFVSVLHHAYVMGTTAQSRIQPQQEAYDPHGLQRHILAQVILNENI
jgi:hypothetical protein